MELYTLQQVYPDRTNFITDLASNVSSFYGSTITTDATILNFVSGVIYSWYIHNYTIYTGEEQAVKSNFMTRLTFDFCDIYLYVEKKIKHFLSLNNQTLFVKGGLQSETTITPDLENDVFTKQASTPSVVSQATDFVDAYTDYQSKTTSKHTGTDTHETDLTRTGSQEEVLRVLASMPKSLTDDIIDAVKFNFVIMGECL